ncbi:hypothetical protein POTOM_035496 [Populus tomentosa]|uniref:Serine-rich protein-related n=1 Tax=Populus tomentosa TaxID=118781 RepID=A0A8X7Z128_POPTO|nr:hypothetical protein POTOM_035496 [Populus tomentosa]
MESGQMVNKGMKVEIPSETETMSSGGTKFNSGFQRQTSASKINCLCSPTSHAGSFRCRLHRSPSLQRTKSIDSASLRDSETNINTTADDTRLQGTRLSTNRSSYYCRSPGYSSTFSRDSNQIDEPL